MIALALACVAAVASMAGAVVMFALRIVRASEEKWRALADLGICQVRLEISDRDSEHIEKMYASEVERAEKILQYYAKDPVAGNPVDLVLQGWRERAETATATARSFRELRNSPSKSSDSGNGSGGSGFVQSSAAGVPGEKPISAEPVVDQGSRSRKMGGTAI
jgi:hypothetical protein